MRYSLPTHTTVVSRGATYRICWSTEASQQVLALYDEGQRNRVSHPITYAGIISAIRLSPNDSQPVLAELGAADLGLFIVKSNGIAYEILVSYYPATATGGSNVCEISGVFISADPSMLAALH